MEDAQLVAAFLDGDRSAFAQIYDRYADRIHDFCHSVLRDRDEAADALQETMLVAHQRLGQLRDPALLRPWLFSIARHDAYRRARRRRRAVPTDDIGSVVTSDDLIHRDVEPARGASADETARLVWDAAAGLASRDRVVLDLHVRQGLSGDDLATALGVSTHHAHVLVSRVRERVERSLGALLVARLGSDDCDELQAILAGWDGTFSALMRKRVARHVDGCETCDETRRRVASPVALLGVMPLAPAPAALRDRVLGEIERISSTRRRPTGRRTRPWAPPPLDRERIRRRGAATAAAAAALVLLGVLVLDDDSPTTVTATDVVLEPTPTAPTTAPVVAGQSAASDDADPSAAPPPPDVAPPTLSPGPGAPAPDEGPPPFPAPPTPEPAPPTTDGPPSSAPPTGGLTLDTTAVALTPIRPERTVRIRNTGDAAMTWQAEASEFIVSPAGGTLGPGASTDLTVALPDTTAEGRHAGGVEVKAADQALGIDVDVDRPPVIDAIRVSPRSAGCGDVVTVALAAHDESDLSARLWWTTPDDSGSIAMTPDGGGWTASISPSSGPMEIAVVATDARGNSTTGDGGVVEYVGCVPGPRR